MKGKYFLVLLLAVSFLVFIYVFDYVWYQYKNSVSVSEKLEHSDGDSSYQNDIWIDQPDIGSKFNTEEYYLEALKKVNSNLEKTPPTYNSFLMGTLIKSELMVFSNITKDDEIKAATIKEAYNLSYGVNQGFGKKNNQNDDRVLVKSVVAPFTFFEAYWFRSDWFIESDWAKDESFLKAFSRYPDKKRLSVLLGFSYKFDTISTRDKVLIGNHMRVISYLLHGFKDNLLQEDKDALLKKLIELRGRYTVASDSFIYGSDLSKNVQALSVTPSIEYAYATEIISLYNPELVKEEEVLSTYKSTFNSVKESVDKNNKPIYMVNKFLWLNLMFIGHLYEKNNFKVTSEIIDLVKVSEEYQQNNAAFTVGSTTAGIYRPKKGQKYNPGWDNEGLGNRDGIRLRGYKAYSEALSYIK